MGGGSVLYKEQPLSHGAESEEKGTRRLPPPAPPCELAHLNPRVSLGPWGLLLGRSLQRQPPRGCHYYLVALGNPSVPQFLHL